MSKIENVNQMFQYLHIKAPPSSTMPTVTKLIQDIFNNKRISESIWSKSYKIVIPNMIPHRMCKAHNFNLIYNQNREIIFEIQMVGCFQTLQVDHS